jgi:hypothetical protein
MLLFIAVVHISGYGSNTHICLHGRPTLEPGDGVSWGLQKQHPNLQKITGIKRILLQGTILIRESDPNYTKV